MVVLPQLSCSVNVNYVEQRVCYFTDSKGDLAKSDKQHAIVTFALGACYAQFDAREWSKDGEIALCVDD